MLPKVDWGDPVQVQVVKKDAKMKIRNLIGTSYERSWKSILKSVATEKERILEEATKGVAIPQVLMQDILAKRVPEQTIQNILKKGAAVIRGVIPQETVNAGYADLIQYLADNKYDEQKVDPNLDQYFSDLDSKKPQIFNIYWSKTQMNIRQHENMAQAKAFLNHLWKYEKDGQRYFEPDKECIYADRFRMRAPGDTSLGLSPHIDGGSIERWVDDANMKIYKPIFEGNWEQYNPFDGAYRNEVENIPSPAVCRAFRTYQGWVALTEQGPGDGTLQLIPMLKQSTAYLLMRPFLEDVEADVLCGAEPIRAQAITQEWHQALLDAKVSIPQMMPGDTVWWHHDLIHAVENEHTGTHTSSVTYIGSSPLCKRNKQYLELQKPTYLEGLSSPDFAAEHREKDYANRSRLDDLSDLGKKQMGFLPWV